MSKNKPKYNMWQNSWFMAKLAWKSKEKKVVFMMLALAILAVGQSLAETFIVPVILTAVEQHAPIGQFALTVGIFVAVLMIVAMLQRYLENCALYGRITVRTSIINLINNKTATTSYPNLSDENFRKLVSKARDCTSSNSAATEAIWETLTNVISGIVGFGVFLALLTTAQPWLMLIAVVTSVVSYFISNAVNSYGYKHRKEEAAYQSQMDYFSRTSGDFSPAKDIRIFGLRPWLAELHQKAIEGYHAFHKKAQSVYIWGKIADLIFAFLRNAAAYAFLIAMVLNNTITVTEFLLYFTSVSAFTQWITTVLGAFNELHKQSLDISSVRELLDFPESFVTEGGKPIPDSCDKWEISLQNVSFRYPNAEKDVLHNINLTLHNGEKLAVVGLNGAGKTTLIKLMCGFLDPTQGVVTLNGTDVRQFNRRDYYTLFSAVFQKFSVLAETIAVNVAQSVDNVDMQRVKQCVQQAGLTEKVESLPEGYQSKLVRNVFDEAVDLSGGEMQRLMLARALYKDAPFIMLDEPTAALDPIAEADLYNKYNQLTLGKSSVYISHRLASTRFCDRIVLIADGGIAEEGTHQQLLEQKGVYAQLFEVQSKYYKEEEDE